MNLYYIAWPDGRREGPMPQDSLFYGMAHGVYKESCLVWTDGYGKLGSFVSHVSFAGSEALPSQPLFALETIDRFGRLVCHRIFLQF